VIVLLVSPESSALTGTALEAFGLSNPLFGPLIQAGGKSWAGAVGRNPAESNEGRSAT
jgi:hypothetical protein